MGGSYSEPGTLADLAHSVLKLQTKSERIRVGWFHTAHPDLPLDALIMGLQHVDDCLLASRLFCTSCIEKGVQLAWPEDVGVSTEEFGSVITFFILCHRLC